MQSSGMRHLQTDPKSLRRVERSGIQLTKVQGAQVTALYVMLDDSAMIYSADALMTYNAAEFENGTRKNADKVLQLAVDIAKAEGVECKTGRVMNISVNQAAVPQAQDSQCDLICMDSDGREGIAGILLGSETQRVLVNSKVPVLLHRPVV